jgi:gas vesicle protein
MDDRSAILIGALAGALIGGAAGYLYFTESGRRVREEFEPRMNDVIAELQRARLAAARAVNAAGEGWQSVRQMDSTRRSRGLATESPIL